MIDKKCLKLMDTKCKHDYRDRHRWDRIGIVLHVNHYAIWECSQCGLCVSEQLEFLSED